jgi:RNA polymerase I-specific transcription initiation factor RRN3
MADHEVTEACVAVPNAKAGASPNDDDASSQVLVPEASRLDDYDPLFVLPKCVMPLQSELAPVETFVENAIREQDQLSDTTLIKTYKGILEAFRLKNDPDMLRKVLLALRTAGRGSTLHLLTSSSSSSRKHARLIHQILRLNPFELLVPSLNSTSSSQVADYDLADAQLHLLLAVVSSNTVFLVPTLTFAWKLLTSQYESVPIER